MPDTSSGGLWLRRLIVPVLMAGLLVVIPSAARAQSCTAGTDSDFDGDGLADLAIGDPDATVSGKARAGRVHIAYGDGGTQTIVQSGMPGNDNAAGDRFGHALASTDWNGDGCSDLIVGVPNEDWAENTQVDAGILIYIPGSPAGPTPLS